jgi:hypothetical protein
MRILLLNGSPRREAASSRIVLDQVRARLGEGHEYSMAESMPKGRAEPEDLEADFIVLAFPLYIDSLHSKLLSWLLSYEALRSSSPGPARRVGMAAIGNCGFKEGIQNKTALDIVANFCARSGLEWRGGLGIGSGEMLRELKDAPDGMPIKRPVSRALAAISERIAAFPGAGDDGAAPALRLYASHGIPWLGFKLAAHFGWRRQARGNGLRPRAVFARPYLPAR